MEWTIPGKFLYYATAMPRRTGAIPLIATTVDGRPIKLEGNPLHPASGGATDTFVQASILDLYDPSRSRRFVHKGKTSNRADFADYDGDGRLDIYFCVYSYYLGLDQYHYPVPYFDARNGPPNYLLHNQGNTTFVDRTEAAGLQVENDRYSFACAWGHATAHGFPDLYVANDEGQSLLVFHGATDNGDVAPARIIKGNNTHLSYPIGLTIDTKNKELWAVNLGNSSATVYSLAANGNVTPVRMIRGAPLNKNSMRFGKTSTVAYDTKRDQILVPN